MDVLYIGSANSTFPCKRRRVESKQVCLQYGEELLRFRIWCVHTHAARFLSGMYPKRRVVVEAPLHEGLRRRFPQAQRTRGRADLFLVLLRYSAGSLQWSAPLGVK